MKISEKPEPTFESMMEFVSRRCVYSQENYPNADLRTPDSTRAFILENNILHLQKSVGRIAAQREEYDHGGIMNEDVLRLSVTKMFANILALAHGFHITADHLTIDPFGWGYRAYHVQHSDSTEKAHLVALAVKDSLMLCADYIGALSKVREKYFRLDTAESRNYTLGVILHLRLITLRLASALGMNAQRLADTMPEAIITG